MSDPVAIITGAGRGIGRATAVELSRRGYRLALAARTTEQLEETRRLVGDATIVPTDVSNPDAVEQLVKQTLTAYGRIDAVINNAGVAPMMPAERMTTEQWHQVIDTNLSAAFFMTRAVWPTFCAQKAGVIVSVSSVASRDPFAGLAAYAAAKAGLNMLGLVLSREGKEFGIRVHTVAPGAVETGMFRAIATTAQWPEEKTLAPQEVAAVIGQCVCGDLRYTSGEVIFMSKEVGT
jgi:NAD(P)-dependent dehydrogenase (short-subunit alcohol dehydrogenase family)